MIAAAIFTLAGVTAFTANFKATNEVIADMLAALLFLLACVCWCLAVLCGVGVIHTL